MVKNVKSKKAIWIVAAAMICLVAVLFLIKGQLDASVEPANSVQRELALTNEETGLQKAPNGEEGEDISEEWFAVDRTPRSVSFRDYTITLEKCEVTKELGNQPNAKYVSYKNFKTDENGTILSAHSYVHVTFKQKNEAAKEQVAGINTSKLFIAPAGEEIWSAFVEPSSMDQNAEYQNRPDYYSWTFGPGDEQEFTVTYVVADELLTEDYDLYYSFNPRGASEDIPLEDGKEKIRYDARFLMLDQIVTGDYPVILSAQSAEEPESSEDGMPLVPYVPYEEKTGNHEEILQEQSEVLNLTDYYTLRIDSVRFSTEEEALKFLRQDEVKAWQGRTKAIVVTATLTKSQDVSNRAELTAIELRVGEVQNCISLYGFLDLNEGYDSTTMKAGDSITVQLPYEFRDISFGEEEWENFTQQEFELVCLYEYMKYSNSNDSVVIPLKTE